MNEILHFESFQWSFHEVHSPESLVLLGYFWNYKEGETYFNNPFTNPLHLEQAKILLNLLFETLRHGDSGSSIRSEVGPQIYWK